MSQAGRKFRVFLSAAEPSGDAHCAALARELGGQGDIELVGVGGPKMAEAGVELLAQPADRAAMTYKAFAHIKYFHSLIKRVKFYFADNKVDLVIVCDSPAFNFHIAKAAKRSGSKTLFYVAPQLWAWAPWRIHKLRRCCDKLCCILPFEKQWFADRGVRVEFVGNPLVENGADPMKKYYLGYEPGRAKVALMPGSRQAELDTLWIPMQQIAKKLLGKYPQMTFTAVAVDEDRMHELKARQIEGFDCDYSVGSVYETARKSDFTIVASGSATVQVAAAGCPMVIMYQSSKLLWNLVGRWLVTTKYLSLVNILGRRELVPEYMPYFESWEEIESRVDEMLAVKDVLIKTSNDLVDVVKPLAEKHASQRVAAAALDMLR